MPSYPGVGNQKAVVEVLGAGAKRMAADLEKMLQWSKSVKASKTAVQAQRTQAAVGMVFQELKVLYKELEVLMKASGGVDEEAQTQKQEGA